MSSIISRVIFRLFQTLLLAAALLSSGCSEVEGPLPLRPVDSRSVTGGRVSHSYGEIRATKGTRTLTLNASSALGVPVESVPEEEGFTRAVIEPDAEGAAVLWEAGDSIKVQFLRDGALYYAWSRYLIVQRIMTLSGDLGAFSFDSWLARDVTLDPIRDGDGDGLGTRTAYRSPYRLQEPYYPVIWEEAIPFAPPVAMEE